MVICLFYFISFPIKSLATNQIINCLAEYKDSTTYDITITGLEPEEDYDYYIIISLKKEVTGSDFLRALGNSLSITYEAETKKWKTTTMWSLDGVKPHDEFERQGQYYLHVAKKLKSSIQYEIIAGPIPVDTPKLPPLGERIKVNAPSGLNTAYSIQVNALNTMFYNGVQRTIHFYLGEITDTTLLKQLQNHEKDAYENLLQYAKKQKENLKKDSFQDTKTGVLDYNILADYKIEAGKHYFLYVILDDENGTYVPVEDIEAYNGEWNYTKGEGGLRKFSYQEEQNKEDKPNTNNMNQVINNETIEEKQNNQMNEIVTRDNTVANTKIPQTGDRNIKVILLVGIIIVGIIIFIKYKKYKETP